MATTNRHMSADAKSSPPTRPTTVKEYGHVVQPAPIVQNIISKTPELSNEEKARAVKLSIANFFQFVITHVLVLQSDVNLFAAANQGNQAATARMLSLSSFVTGILSLFVNQIGGKVSDAIGRRPLLQAGSAVNMLVAMAVLARSKSPNMLFVCRILKIAFTTFSGTVISSSILGDTIQAEERRLIGPQVMLAVSAALISGPIAESVIIRRAGGDPRAAYKAVACLSAFQLFQNCWLMPETLSDKARRRFRDVAHVLEGVNPFSFLKLFFSEHTALKRLVVVQALQLQGEGKVSSDLFQMWTRVNLKWSAKNIRDFVSGWGAIGAACNVLVVPKLHQNFNLYDYCSIVNAGGFLGIMIHSAAEKGICMWGALPFFLPGVNGSAATATGALSAQFAKVAGYGNAEFAAWITNIKALSQSFTTLLLGWWYARCKDKGRYQGSTWMLDAFISCAAPQLLMWKMGRESFKSPGHVEPPKENPLARDEK